MRFVFGALLTFFLRSKTVLPLLSLWVVAVSSTWRRVITFLLFSPLRPDIVAHIPRATSARSGPRPAHLVPNAAERPRSEKNEGAREQEHPRELGVSSSGGFHLADQGWKKLADVAEGH